VRARDGQRDERALALEHHAVVRVAAEELVAAVGGERDLHVLARHLRHEVGGHARLVAERLVEELRPLREHPEHVLRGDDLLGVARAEVLGRPCARARLVVARVVEADGEGAHLAAAVALQESCDQRRIEAAGEEHADRHVETMR
jgi:hypothetical protein